MSYILAFLILLLLAGVLLRAFLPRGPRHPDEDVTDRHPRPPRRPDEPVPGSAPQRHRHGQP